MVAPKRGSPRGKGKAAALATNRYEGAGFGRRLAAFSPPSNGPNRALNGLERLRSRARDLTRNEWAGASGVQKWTTSLVGVGITPRWAAGDHAKRWARFVAQSDADGVLNLYGQQALGVRSWIDGGEVFVRRRPRDLRLPLAVPLQIQLIEGDHCPLFDTMSWPGLPAGNVIRQGVEFNRYGRRVAYWMYREHPQDVVIGAVPDPSRLVRVLASDIAHVFEPKRPGQIRGVSDMAAVLTRIRNAGDYEDFVLDRQKLANLFVMFITKQLPDDWSDLDLEKGLPSIWKHEEDEKAVGLEPGLTQELRPGEKAEFSNPPEAGTTYSDYLRTTHLGTSAGWGLPYELFTGDARDVSDRTLRVIINEFRRFAEQRQWHVIIPQMCAPIARWWAEALALKGELSARRVEEAASPDWYPHGWAYIHPVQDVTGKKLEVEAGFTSATAVILQRGDDPDLIREQRANDKRRNEEAGLAVAAVSPQQAAANAQAQKEADTRARIAEAEASVGRAKAEADRVAAETRAAEAASAAARAEADVRIAEANARVAEAQATARAAEAAVARAAADARAAEAQAQASAAEARARQAEAEAAAAVAAAQAAEADAGARTSQAQAQAAVAQSEAERAQARAQEAQARAAEAQAALDRANVERAAKFADSVTALVGVGSA